MWNSVLLMGLMTVNAVCAEGHGLAASYFDNKFLRGMPSQSRTDPNLDFDWGAGSPAGVAKPFSAWWRGDIDIPASGTWTFTALSDDGLVLAIDRQVVVTDWSDHPARERAGSIDITSPGRHRIDVVYYDQGGSAVAKLDWQGPGVGRERIPPAALFLPSTPRVVIPAESAVSPLFIDADARVSSSVRCRARGSDVAVTTLSATEFALDIPLRPNGANPIEITTDGVTSRARTRWIPTPVQGDVAFTLRVGDSLLLSAPAHGTVNVFQDCGVLFPPFSVRRGTTVPVAFTVPGTYVIELHAPDGDLIGRVTVSVVAVTYHLPIADQIGYEREYHCTVRPASAPVWFGSDDLTRGWARADSQFVEDAAVRLQDFSAQPMKLLARIGGPHGPIVAASPVSPYEILDNTRGGYVLHRDEEGFGHGQFVMRLMPRVEKQRIVIDFFTGAATIDGQGRLELTSDDLDADGSFMGDLLVFPDHDITCHSISVFDE